MGQEFHPQKFVEALESDQLEPTPVLQSFRVYTRKENPYPGRIEVSPDCLTWLHLSLSVVEKIDYLGQKQCPSWVPGEIGHHVHAFVEIHPKQPHEDASEAEKGYFGMLQAVLSSRHH